MLRKSGAVLVLLTAVFSMGCGTASPGSLHQSQTGVSESGYPGGQPTDAESPATGSSTEQKYARAGDKATGAAAAAEKMPAATEKAPAAK